MKVIAINGSPRKDGNTSILIQTVFKELETQDIETKEINVAKEKIQGCLACMKCWESQNGHCVINNDKLNSILDEMSEADGIIIGSPVYCADLSGQVKCFMDRACMVACANDDMFKRKVGAAVVAVRRAGAVSTFHSINSYFTIAQMLVVGSSYWNLGFGMEPGEVSQDEEGLQTMRNLGRNMAWILQCIEKTKDEIMPPETKREVSTNFVR